MKIKEDKLPWWVFTIRLFNGVRFGLGQNMENGRPNFWRYVPSKGKK